MIPGDGLNRSPVTARRHLPVRCPVQTARYLPSVPISSSEPAYSLDDFTEAVFLS